jgi:hypothetical protein
VKIPSGNGAFESRLLSDGALARGFAIVCSSRYKTCLVGFKGLVIMCVISNGALARGLGY